MEILDLVNIYIFFKCMLGYSYKALRLKSGPQF